MRIAIGADHAGYVLKDALQAAFPEVEWTDCGTDGLASCDYPDFAFAVARAVALGEVDAGLLVCGTGVGMSLAANRVPGIRAACCSEPYTARLARDHNDANVLCLGSRVIGEGVAEDIVRVWLETPYSGGERHQRRLDKIAAAEAGGAGR
ncbi:MAG: ribose 5-phosphate isomerase B [Fimbriimonadaceae bacterium]|nr:ribose 5-phosphate isomerase B [Fimbriimonadaceae bacterium]